MNIFKTYKTKADTIVSVDTYAKAKYTSYNKIIVPAGTEFVADKYTKGDTQVLVFEPKPGTIYYAKDEFSKGSGTTNTVTTQEEFNGTVEIPLEACKRVLPWALILGIVSVFALAAYLIVKKRNV